MYLDKKQNIFKNIYFSMIVVPIVTFIFILIENFAKNFHEADKIIMTYLTIGVIALFVQTIIYFKKPIKHASLNYLYIIFAINISLFIGYILGKFIIPYDKWWQKWMLNPLIVFVIIFGIKTVLWWTINFIYKKRVKQDNNQLNLQKANKQLKQEIDQIKEQQIENAHEEEKDLEK